MHICTYVYMFIFIYFSVFNDIHVYMRPLPGTYLKTIRSEYTEVGLKYIESSAGVVIVHSGLKNHALCPYMIVLWVVDILYALKLH